MMKSKLQQLAEKVEGLLQYHSHNSILNLVDEVDEGCQVCIRNEVVDKVLELIKERNR